MFDGIDDMFKVLLITIVVLIIACGIMTTLYFLK